MRPQDIGLPPLLLALALVPAGCGARQPGEFQVDRVDWVSSAGRPGVRVLTPHWDIRTTVADEPLLELLPAFLEEAFDGYCDLIPPPRIELERLVVYLFGTRREWAEFTVATFPAQASLYLYIHEGGYSDPATAIGAAFDIGRDRTLALLGHEGMHQYFAAYFPIAVPAWLNEGLATQWEGFRIDRGRPVFTPRRNHFRANGLREALTATGGWIGLRKLLNMDAGQAVLKTGQTARGYYAQIWALLLMLREADEGRWNDSLRLLLCDLATGRAPLSSLPRDPATTAPAESGRLPVDADTLADQTGRDAAPRDDDTSSIGEILFRRYVTPDIEAFEADYRAFAESLVF